MKLFFLCPQGYQSTSVGAPPKDPTPDYTLIKATEKNGYTNVQFERDPTTDGDDKDVQFLVRFFIITDCNENNTFERYLPITVSPVLFGSSLLRNVFKNYSVTYY